MARIRPEEISGIILELARKLRRSGVRIGTSEVVQAERIVRDYMLLVGEASISVEDLASLLVSLWPGATGREEQVRGEIERLLSSASVERRARKIMEELLESVSAVGARPGDRVSLRRAMRGGRKEKNKIKAAYVKLRRVGAITGRSGKERLVDEGTLRSIAYKLARAGFDSIEDVLRRGRPPRSRDEALLHMEAGFSFSKSQLETLSESRLLKIGWDAVKKHDYRTQRAVAEVLRERIAKGEPVRDPEGVISYLRKTHFLTSDVLMRLLERGEPVEGLSVDTIASVISMMPDEQAGVLISKYRNILSPEEYLRLLSMTEPRKMWALGDKRIPGDDTGIYRAMGSAARALREALNYASTLDEARADMSLYYAERAENILSGSAGLDPRSDTVRALASTARKLVALVEGSAGYTARQFYEAVAGLSLEDAIIIARALYAAASSEGEREMLVKGFDRVLGRLMARNGLTPLGRRVQVTSGGRLDVRKSIYNLVRHRPNPLVFNARARSKPLALALDVSGSMEAYSSWALAVSSVFARHLERIVLFNHAAHVYEGPFSRRQVVRLLLEAEFGGRTDITTALRAVSGRLRSKRVVVVSDLSQTVDSDPPWSVAGDLRRRGIKLVFITHERHDLETRRRLEAEQARIIVARSPREAAARILSLLR